MPGVRRTGFAVGLAALVAGAAWSVAGSLSAEAAPASGTVYVFQGLTGITADVKVDGSSVASDVAGTTVVGPLRLAAGRHVVALSSADGQLTTASVTVTSGGSLDVLGYWAAETPRMARLTVLKNDLSPVGMGSARLVVTHGLAGPPADIRVNGKVLFRSVANGESLTVTVPAGTYTVTAVATLGGQTLLPASTLRVAAGTLTRAVAVGAPGGKPGVLVHVLPIPGAVSGGHTPSMVRTGDGGQASGLFALSTTGTAGLPRLAFAALSAAFLLLAVGLAASARRVAASRHAR
jgi:uncharacterized protein DUF4397